MINLNTIVANTNSVSTNVNATPVKASAPKADLSAPSASTVVDLQTNTESKANDSKFVIDSSNAAAMVADIAALLGGSDGGVQANINGFDAARLLA